MSFYYSCELIMDGDFNQILDPLLDHNTKPSKFNFHR